MKKSDNPIEVLRLHSFEAQLKKITKKFKSSKVDIEETINSLASNLDQGDPVQAGPLHVRKIRIPLKAYSIGKSKGIRLLALVQIDLNRVIPIAIYHKGDINKEGDASKLIREQLKKIFEELDNPTQPTA